QSGWWASCRSAISRRNSNEAPARPWATSPGQGDTIGKLLKPDRSAAAAFAAAVLLASCASTDPELVAARDSWKNARYDDVVRAWGPPDRSATKSGQETHTWVARDGLPTPGLPG